MKPKKHPPATDPFPRPVQGQQWVVVVKFPGHGSPVVFGPLGKADAEAAVSQYNAIFVSSKYYASYQPLRDPATFWVNGKPDPQFPPGGGS